MCYGHELPAETVIFVEHISDGLLEAASINTPLHVRSQHDCAPPHYSHKLRHWLSENYAGRWNGRGPESPAFRPARPPDFGSILIIPSWG
jgi:hypothetical protein